MTEMPIAEQHRIVHELVERYQFETEGIYTYNKITKDYNIFIFTQDTKIPRADYTMYAANFFMLVTAAINTREVMMVQKSIQELQETCFQDLLNPTLEELVLFELQYGFEWPLTGDKNESS